MKNYSDFTHFDWLIEFVKIGAMLLAFPFLLSFRFICAAIGRYNV